MEVCHSHPESETAETQDCTLCECFTEEWRGNQEWKTSGQLEKLRQFLFHDECSACAAFSMGLLCEVCRHMRLGHIIRCWYAKKENDPRRAFELSFGRVRVVDNRSKTCVICEKLSHVARRFGQLDPEDMVILRVRTGAAHEFFPEVGIFYFEGETRKYRVNKYTGKPLDGTFDGIIGNPGTNITQHPDRRVNWETVNSWLKTCKDVQKCSHKGFPGQPPRFRVIEIATQRVVPAPPSCKYAALSYVWGGAAHLDIEARESNMHDLQTVGLSEQPLPATIKDAIVACSHMGIEYLWVDRLCILQDSMIDKQTQIHAMDVIYSNSVVTIVALGSDVHYGLPGVSRNRPLPWTYDGQGIFMIEEHPWYAEIVARSKWYTRGWTFQEALLSPNLLLFSDCGVFYECATNDYALDEDKRLRGQDRPYSIFDMNRVGSPVGTYGDLVTTYTRRDLSWESDILRAISGILNFRYGPDNYFGLALREFSNALFWKPASHQYMPRVPSDGGVFPSWSWASVTGPIDLVDYTSSTTGIAVCISVSEHLILRTISPHLPPNKSGWMINSADHELQALAVGIAWREGCFTTKAPDTLMTINTWKEYLDVIKSNWASFPHLLRDAFAAKEACIARAAISQADLLNTFSLEDLKRASHPGRLIFHTQALQLKISRSGNGYTILQTANQKVIAYMIPGSFDERIHDKQSLTTIAISINFTGSRLLEQIDLYKSGLVTSYDGISWRDSDGEFPYSQWCFPNSCYHFTVNLMVLDGGNSLYRRIGLAQTFLKTWVEAKPEFGSFVLE